MNRYRLLHVTEFQYDGPVSESYNQVWLRPRQDDRQSCLSFRLTTDPHSRASSYVDPSGNWVHRFNITAEHRRLRVEAESVVLVQEPLPMPADTMSLSELGDHAEELEEHGKRLDLMIGLTLHIYSVASNAMPDVLRTITGRLRQLEDSRALVHNPMSQEEADAILRQAFPDEPATGRPA